MDVSNRCIADRLRLHEEKQVLLQQLRDGMRTVSRLESQLKVGMVKSPNDDALIIFYKGHGNFLPRHCPL